MLQLSQHSQKAHLSTQNSLHAVFNLDQNHQHPEAHIILFRRQSLIFNTQSYFSLQRTGFTLRLHAVSTISPRSSSGSLHAGLQCSTRQLVFNSSANMERAAPGSLQRRTRQSVFNSSANMERPAPGSLQRSLHRQSPMQS